MTETLRICGQDVELVYSDPKEWSANGMGRSWIHKARITINEDMPKTAQHSTLLHEIIEYIADTNDFGEEFMKNETIKSVLANSLLAFMRDNPEIISDIISIVKKKGVDRRHQARD